MAPILPQPIWLTLRGVSTLPNTNQKCFTSCFESRSVKYSHLFDTVRLFYISVTLQILYQQSSMRPLDASLWHENYLFLIRFRSIWLYDMIVSRWRVRVGLQPILWNHWNFDVILHYTCNVSFLFVFVPRLLYDKRGMRLVICLSFKFYYCHSTSSLFKMSPYVSAFWA